MDINQVRRDRRVSLWEVDGDVRRGILVLPLAGLGAQDVQELLENGSELFLAFDKESLTRRRFSIVRQELGHHHLREYVPSISLGEAPHQTLWALAVREYSHFQQGQGVQVIPVAGGGVLRRSGLAEAALDVITWASLGDGAVFTRIVRDLPHVLSYHLDEIIAYARQHTSLVREAAMAEMPTAYGMLLGLCDVIVGPSWPQP